MQWWRRRGRRRRRENKINNRFLHICLDYAFNWRESRVKNSSSNYKLPYQFHLSVCHSPFSRSFNHFSFISVSSSSSSSNQAQAQTALLYLYPTISVLNAKNNMHALDHDNVAQLKRKIYTYNYCASFDASFTCWLTTVKRQQAFKKRTTVVNSWKNDLITKWIAGSHVKCSHSHKQQCRSLICRFIHLLRGVCARTKGNNETF